MMQTNTKCRSNREKVSEIHGESFDFLRIVLRIVLAQFQNARASLEIERAENK
jgi:hypothetical protein